MKKELCYLLIIGLIIGIGCKSHRKYGCDYLEISRNLLEDIKRRNVTSIQNLLAFKDQDYWKKGGEWELFQNTACKIIDTLSDVKKLQYKVTFNKNNDIYYAVVTFTINRQPPIVDVFTVNFLNPHSPLGCKIQSFDYSKLGTSDKIDLPAPIIK